MTIITSITKTLQTDPRYLFLANLTNSQSNLLMLSSSSTSVHNIVTNQITNKLISAETETETLKQCSNSLDRVLVQRCHYISNKKFETPNLSLTDLNRVQIGSRKQTADGGKKERSCPPEKTTNNLAMAKSKVRVTFLGGGVGVAGVAGGPTDCHHDNQNMCVKIVKTLNNVN